MNRPIPVIAACDVCDGPGSMAAYAVSKPADGAVWLYWLDAGVLVDEVTLSLDVACQTLTALSGAIDTFELAEALSKPIVSGR